MEYFDVYDSNGDNTNAIVPRSNCKEMLRKINGYHVVVLGLIVVNHRLILVDQRALNKDYGGYWEIPGGGLKSGEMSIHGVLREVKEELGLSISEFQCKLAKRCFDDNWRIIYDIYVIDLKELNLNDLSIQSQELKQVALVSKQQFKSMIDHERVLRFDLLLDLVNDFIED